MPRRYPSSAFIRRPVKRNSFAARRPKAHGWTRTSTAAEASVLHTGSAIRRNDQAHVSDHESTGNASALNAGDGWLRKIQNAKRVIEIAALLVSVAILDRQCRSARLTFLQIVPRGEVVTLARDNDDADGIVRRCGTQGCVKFVEQDAALRVAGFPSIMEKPSDLSTFLHWRFACIQTYLCQQTRKVHGGDGTKSATANIRCHPTGANIVSLPSRPSTLKPVQVPGPRTSEERAAVVRYREAHGAYCTGHPT
jgi:hypothetical protein